MFKCDRCGQSSQPGDRIIRKITSQRSKTYYVYVVKATQSRQPAFLTSSYTLAHSPDYRIVKTLSYEGFEIVKEDQLCLKCHSEES